MNHFFQITLLTACLGYCAIAAAALFLSDFLIFPAPKPNYQDNRDIFYINLPDHGLSIPCYYLQSKGVKITILYSHGNGEDLGSIGDRLEILNQLGFNALAYDYPGYGQSEGSPSETNTYLAAQAAYNYLRTERNIPAECIFLYGRSLGGGPSIELASNNPAGGIILEGAFTSAFRVKTHWKLLPWDKFDNFKKIKGLHCPVLVIHGTHDHTVPFWHGRALYEAAPEEKMKLWVEGAGHNNIIENAGSIYSNTLLAFIQKYHDQECSCHSSPRS